MKLLRLGKPRCFSMRTGKEVIEDLDKLTDEEVEETEKADRTELEVFEMEKIVKGIIILVLVILSLFLLSGCDTREKLCKRTGGNWTFGDWGGRCHCLNDYVFSSNGCEEAKT